jgi:hypothetical protein
MVRFEVEMSENDGSNLIESLSKQLKLIDEGGENARSLSYHIKNVISLHLECGKAMTKNDLVAICKAINILKGIELIFNRSVASHVTVQLLYYSQDTQWTQE